MLGVCSKQQGCCKLELMKIFEFSKNLGLKKKRIRNEKKKKKTEKNNKEKKNKNKGNKEKKENKKTKCWLRKKLQNKNKKRRKRNRKGQEILKKEKRKEKRNMKQMKAKTHTRLVRTTCNELEDTEKSWVISMLIILNLNKGSVLSTKNHQNLLQFQAKRLKEPFPLQAS